MSARIEIKTTFEIDGSIQPIYTGGSVALDRSGRILVTCLGEDALLTDLKYGKQLARLDGVRVLPHSNYHFLPIGAYEAWNSRMEKSSPHYLVRNCYLVIRI